MRRRTYLKTHSVTLMSEGRIAERTPADRFFDQPDTDRGREFLSRLL
jgi:ABC-type polar amino acid transport system ATPase subunit